MMRDRPGFGQSRWCGRPQRPLACAAALFVVLTACSPSAPIAPAHPPAHEEITVVAAGDLLLGRRLGRAMAESKDFTLPFRPLGAELAAAGITFGNLEGPFCAEPPYPEAGLTFRVRPQALEGLRFAGFDVLSLANNHVLDGGSACLRFTLDHLRGAGIRSVGAGANFSEAHAPAIVERGGVKFAFLAYTYAGYNDRPGADRLVVAGRNVEHVHRNVTAAREQADVVLVSLHDGAEYTRRVARETEQFARAAIEAGATAIFGHHPHVPQRVEAYRGGWIFYSLGNFAFEQRAPGTRTGLMVRLTFVGPALERVEAIPVFIEPFSQPGHATAEQARAILQVIGWADSTLWVRSKPSATAAVAR
ncbi:MAG: CapA family protein [Firmicutes bacterium]|nr:CapA family protein [Bacillota bacterium]